MDLNPFRLYPQGVGADPHIALALPPESKQAKEKTDDPSFQPLDSDEMTIRIGRAGPLSGKPPFIYPHQPLQCVLDLHKKKAILHVIKKKKHTAVATAVPLCLSQGTR